MLLLLLLRLKALLIMLISYDDYAEIEHEMSNYYPCALI